MTNADLIEVGKELAAAAKSYVRDSVEAIRIELVTKIDGIALTPGPAGADGADGAAGRDGINGKDGTPGERGADGINGKDGQPGAPGPAGADGADGAAGRDGVDGKDGAPGLDGKDGRDGRDGVDGKSVSVDDIRGALEVEIARALLDLERRAMDVIQRAVEKIPTPAAGKDGAPGRDGIGHDDVEEQLEDGGRILVRRYMREGAVVREFRHVTASLVHRGTYTSDREYLAGDCVTWGGGTFVAKETTRAVPGTKDQASSAWHLAVMRGKEGKQGPQGPSGAKPVVKTS